LVFQTLDVHLVHLFPDKVVDVPNQRREDVM
jgi:hypothetical protein